MSDYHPTSSITRYKITFLGGTGVQFFTVDGRKRKRTMPSKSKYCHTNQGRSLDNPINGHIKLHFRSHRVRLCGSIILPISFLL